MNKKPLLSVSIIVHNEARDLAECLASIRGLAAEVVVVDCASSDGSATVARRAGAKVFRRPNLPNLNVNKAFGVSKARGEWILYLDPDERLTAAGRREILSTIRHSSPAIAIAAFDMPRRNFYFGTWLRHGSKYPDRQRRLFRRGCAAFPARHVHERLAVRGRVGRLKEPFDHHPYPTTEIFLRKLDFYAKFEAGFLRKRGVRPGLFTALRYLFVLPFTRFIRRYFFKLGFLDGAAGFLGCLHDALTYMFTYAHLAKNR